MNAKIEPQKTSRITEFSPLFTRGLVVTTCATLLLVFGASPYYAPFGDAKSLMAPPQIIASAIMVGYGIDEFQGIALQDVILQTRPEFLLSLMIEFVVLPVCFLCGWRYLFQKKSQQTGDADRPKRHLLVKAVFGISGVLIVYLLLGNISSAFISPRIYHVMILDNAVDQNRSAVITQLSRIGYKANEYYCLPKRAGGGEKSYRSWLDPAGKTPITLQELGMPGATDAGTFSVVRIVNDTTLLCKGIGKVALSDGGFPEYTMHISVGAVSPTKIN